ncbi:hypothetical protein NQ317_012736 [Molorchus minor]|uniref:Uncharacterized protein n=1 Tax=Molorchus minor TaxID=1323400 RepID=A0ABQ9JM08_9CUCU|nr:hypothetical protein NQ317_012736 [Molorchus minor]
MARVQIFVLAFAAVLAQGYSGLAISNLPAGVQIETRPLPVPTPEIETRPLPVPTPEVETRPLPVPTPEVETRPLPVPTPEIDNRPLPIPAPETEQPEQPICVTYVKLLLQAIIDKLGNLPVVTRPTPEVAPEIEVVPPQPEVETTPEEETSPEVENPPDVGLPEPEVEDTQPEVSEDANPCVACFTYINNLIESAETATSRRK